jgi:hypothetical protein
VAGERIGGFVLGKAIAELLPASAGLAEVAQKYDIQVELDGPRIAELATGSPRYHTADDVKVGSAYDQVEAAWGPPAERNDLEGGGLFDFKASWPARGIDCAVKDGKLIYIGVFPAMKAEI